MQSLIIAHRLSTILFSDQILYIENGKLLETGNHQNLLKKNGKYAHLWKLQSKAMHKPETVNALLLMFNSRKTSSQKNSL
ncbi:MAG TPA: hypothetical protein VLE95_05455 [Chlamydiales bacterium]|nr:hypothetical protein [Chlamydiales bacterium]